jgi:hypothetical protein
MVGNRPTGVRNPVCSTSIYSFLRAKNAGTASPTSGKACPGETRTDNHLKVSPVLLLEAAHYFNEKKY